MTNEKKREQQENNSGAINKDKQANQTRQSGGRGSNLTTEDRAKGGRHSHGGGRSS